MTNEYTVNVDEKTYHITVEHNNNPSINHTDFSEELSYEATKAEYDHCVQRSEKLDNKVYIILTVYAFLFVLLCDIIKKISDFSFPKSNIQLALLIIYSILLTLNVSLYVLTCVFRLNGTACTLQREGCPLQTGSFLSYTGLRMFLPFSSRRNAL